MIPKTEKVERVAGNFDVFGWEKELAKEDIEKIAALNCNKRTIDLTYAFNFIYNYIVISLPDKQNNHYKNVVFCLLEYDKKINMIIWNIK